QGRFLAETHDLTVLSSSRDLVLPPPSGKTSAPAIVSAPDYDHPRQVAALNAGKIRGAKTRGVKLADIHVSPLPGTAVEGRLIGEMLRGKGQSPRALNGGAASEQAVAGLRRPDILHLATHGFFLDDLTPAEGKTDPRRGVGVIARLNPGSPGRINRPPPVGNPLARSGLALAGANRGAKGQTQADGTDGILTAMEVLSMDLAGTRLVVLSACETGLGDIKNGEGVYGLRRAFQEAGAAAVLSTLWQVDDAGTRAFMTRFYTLFLQGKGAQDSARAVQREFIASHRWRHPFYWAPFVMVGAR
ncbi:MAG: CHAT domain-containing protein, partial [bacterium]